VENGKLVGKIQKIPSAKGKSPPETSKTSRVRRKRTPRPKHETTHYGLFVV